MEFYPGIYENSKGFTLIELVAVLALLALLVSFAVPRFQESILTDNLKKTARDLSGIIHSSRERSVGEQKAHTLFLDLDSNKYWSIPGEAAEEERIAAEEDAAVLPEDIMIRKIEIRGQEKYSSGKVEIRFNKKGYTLPSVILLNDRDGREMSLLIRTFLRKIELFDQGIDLEEL